MGLESSHCGVGIGSRTHGVGDVRRHRASNHRSALSPRLSGTTRFRDSQPGHVLGTHGVHGHVRGGTVHAGGGVRDSRSEPHFGRPNCPPGGVQCGGVVRREGGVPDGRADNHGGRCAHHVVGAGRNRCVHLGRLAGRSDRVAVRGRSRPRGDPTSGGGRSGQFGG